MGRCLQQQKSLVGLGVSVSFGTLIVSVVCTRHITGLNNGGIIARWHVHYL